MTEEEIEKLIILEEIKLQRPFGEMYKNAIHSNILKLKALKLEKLSSKNN